MIATYKKAEESYMAFVASAQNLLNIQTDTDYDSANEWLESLAERYDDSIKTI
jgi:hypothetical protein